LWEDWNLMRTMCEAAPVVSLNCRFLWHIWYGAQVLDLETRRLMYPQLNFASPPPHPPRPTPPHPVRGPLPAHPTPTHPRTLHYIPPTPLPPNDTRLDPFELDPSSGRSSGGS
jgi:hypothetical protein